MKSEIIRKYCSVIIAFSVLILSSCRGYRDYSPLIVLATEKDFGTYTGEILHAEGFNEFTVKSIYDESVELSLLKNYDVVILAQHEIGAVKSEMLRKYVSNGGNLIAFKPDRELYDVFGIESMEGNIRHVWN